MFSGEIKANFRPRRLTVCQRKFVFESDFKALRLAQRAAQLGENRVHILFIHTITECVFRFSYKHIKVHSTDKELRSIYQFHQIYPVLLKLLRGAVDELVFSAEQVLANRRR